MSFQMPRDAGFDPTAAAIRAEWRKQAERNQLRTGQPKLTVAQVLEIRQRYAAGETQRQIASDYDIHVTTVSRIVTSRNWPHAGGEIAA